jgi:hypothetical protein
MGHFVNLIDGNVVDVRATDYSMLIPYGSKTVWSRSIQNYDHRGSNGGSDMHWSCVVGDEEGQTSLSGG